MTESQTYRVTWTIDVEVESPNEAARAAFRAMLDPNSIATNLKIKFAATPSGRMDKAATVMQGDWKASRNLAAWDTAPIIIVHGGLVQAVRCDDPLIDTEPPHHLIDLDNADAGQCPLCFIDLPKTSTCTECGTDWTSPKTMSYSDVIRALNRYRNNNE